MYLTVLSLLLGDSQITYKIITLEQTGCVCITQNIAKALALNCIFALLVNGPDPPTLNILVTQLNRWIDLTDIQLCYVISTQVSSSTSIYQWHLFRTKTPQKHVDPGFAGTR